MQSSTIIVIWNGPWVRSSGGVRVATDLHVRKHMHVRICLSVVMRPNMFVYSHLWQPFWTFDVVHFVMEMVDPKAIFLLTVDRSKLCIYNVHVPTCADRKHYVCTCMLIKVLISGISPTEHATSLKWSRFLLSMCPRTCT